MDRLRRQPRVSKAEKYVSEHATNLVNGVKKTSLSYKQEATGRFQLIKVFVEDRVKEFRTSESLKGYLYIVLGILVTLVQILVDFMRQMRAKVSSLSKSVYRSMYSSVSGVVVNVKEKAVELPNTPVGRRVESVSKRVLGDSRHDQAVEFIKSEVFPRFNRVILTGLEKTNKMSGGSYGSSSSPSGESGRSTEVGSVASPNMQQQKKMQKKK